MSAGSGAEKLSVVSVVGTGSESVMTHCSSGHATPPANMVLMSDI